MCWALLSMGLSRLNDPCRNHRHDEAWQFAIRDDMPGKISVLARETLTHAIAAQLSAASLTILWKAIGKHPA